MARLPLLFAALLSVAVADCSAAFAPQEPTELEKKKRPQPSKREEKEQEPPEEDEGSKPKEYTFNPLQAERELKTGNFYFKKGNYKAAARRFREATMWNPGYADAFLRLAQAQEKLKDSKGAKESYAKYLELAPDGKEADLVRKKIGHQP